MAAARVRGFQGEHLGDPGTLIACAKHFAAYGAAEGGRDYNTVDISERTLHEVYLPPFRAAVQAGVATVMAAFNEVGGVPMTAHRRLLRDLLRGEWGWNGVVVSDWTAIGELVPHGVASDRAAAGRLALGAGVDIDMVAHIYGGELRQEVKSGRVPEALVDEAVRRVLRLKERFGLFDHPYRQSDAARERRTMLSPENRAAARAMAQESIVLLKNEGNILPLSRDLRRLAVIGPLADDRAAPLGPWSVPGRPEDVITVLQGVRRALPAADIIYVPGVSLAGVEADGLAAAVAAARRADAVLLVLGESAEMSGEAKSRASLELPGRQEELAFAVLAAKKPTAVVLMNGRPLALARLAERAPALLETWFLGVEAGPAIADVLFGAVNPSGKLPVSFPRVTGQVPVYYNHKQTGRPADAMVRWSSKYIDTDIGPLFAFGHGLSYTRFSYSDLEVTPVRPARGDAVVVSLTVKNIGERAGAEVVQLYVRDPVASATRPVMELKRFARVDLAPGNEARVRWKLPVTELAVRGEDGRLRVEPGEIQVMVGSSSADLRLRGGFTIR
jgi:beta-glucosidase